MTITLPPKARKLVRDRLKSGRYASAEDVVLAGLASLRRQEELGNFAPGELARLVAEGERSIEREGTVDADEVFEALRQRGRAMRARTAPAGRRRRGADK